MDRSDNDFFNRLGFSPKFATRKQLAIRNQQQATAKIRRLGDVPELTILVGYLPTPARGPERKYSRMSDSEDLARKERRRRLIERLNETEKLLGSHGPARGGQMSEEELAAEIEKERQRNLSRRGFPYTGIGGG
jgi:hypothetical protein